MTINEYSPWTRVRFWEKFALTTVQMALGSASRNSPVAVQFFSQIALLSMRLPIHIAQENRIITALTHWYLDLDILLMWFIE